MQDSGWKRDRLTAIWLKAIISSFPDSLWTAYNSEKVLSILIEVPMHASMDCRAPVVEG